jgi:L-rhamnose mutarotase
MKKNMKKVVISFYNIEYVKRIKKILFSYVKCQNKGNQVGELKKTKKKQMSNVHCIPSMLVNIRIQPCDLQNYKYKHRINVYE